MAALSYREDSGHILSLPRLLRARGTTGGKEGSFWEVIRSSFPLTSIRTTRGIPDLLCFWALNLGLVILARQQSWAAVISTGTHKVWTQNVEIHILLKLSQKGDTSVSDCCLTLWAPREEILSWLTTWTLVQSCEHIGSQGRQSWG